MEASSEPSAVQRRQSADNEELVFNKLHVQEGKPKKHRKPLKQVLLRQVEAAQADGSVSSWAAECTCMTPTSGLR
jgi:hypothetical protein